MVTWYEGRLLGSTGEAGDSRPHLPEDLSQSRRDRREESRSLRALRLCEREAVRGSRRFPVNSGTGRASNDVVGMGRTGCACGRASRSRCDPRGALP